MHTTVWGMHSFCLIVKPICISCNIQMYSRELYYCPVNIKHQNCVTCPKTSSFLATLPVCQIPHGCTLYMVLSLWQTVEGFFFFLCYHSCGAAKPMSPLFANKVEYHLIQLMHCFLFVVIWTEKSTEFSFFVYQIEILLPRAGFWYLVIYRLPQVFFFRTKYLIL